MRPDDRRIEILKLAQPSASNPDISLWLDRARQLESWVNEALDTPEHGPNKRPRLDHGSNNDKRSRRRQDATPGDDRSERLV
jgi:hypothetical protein